MLKIWARSAQRMVNPPQERSETPRIGDAGVRRFSGLGKEKVGWGSIDMLAHFWGVQRAWE